MNMRSRKVVAFFVNTLIFSSMFILIVLKVPGSVTIVTPLLIGAVSLNGIAFIGGAIFSQFIKSKYYRSELDERNGKQR